MAPKKRQSARGCPTGPPPTDAAVTDAAVTDAKASPPAKRAKGPAPPPTDEAVTATAVISKIQAAPLTPLAAALGRIAPIVEKAIEDYNRTKACVDAFERVRDACDPESILRWTSTVPCDRVATHPDNRGGAGLVVAKSFQLATKHHKSGYSYGRASAGAIAQSFPRCPTLRTWIEDHNEELSRSQPALPLLASPQVVALGATHGNGWLRLVRAGAACDNIDLAPSGFLDMTTFTDSSKGFAKAIQSGLTWDVYEYQIFDRWPALTEIFSQAANFKGTQQVTELEGLLTMGRAADAFTKAARPVNWDSVLDSGMQNDPFWKSWSPVLLDMCKHFPTESFLELSGMIKASTTVDLNDLAHFGQSFLKQIAQIQLEKGHTSLRVPIALMLAQTFSPVEFMDSGKYCLLKDTDVVKIKNKKLLPTTIQAEACLEDARKLLASKEVATATRFKLLAHIDHRMALHLTQKGHKSKFGMHFNSFTWILGEWIDKVKADTGLDIQSPWVSIPEHTYEFAGEKMLRRDNKRPSIRVRRWRQLWHPLV